MTSREREHVRYAHEAAVRFLVDGKPRSGRTRNVSRGGVCATLVEPLATGSEVALELVLVFDRETQSDALVLPARVVWCTEIDDAYQVGFAFKPFDQKRAELMALFLRYLDDRQVDRAKRGDVDVDERFG